MQLSEIIKASRQEHALTQDTLAERAGVSVRQVRRWESGESVPSGPRIAPLADALQLSPGALSELCNAPSDVREHGRRVRVVVKENGADEVRRDESMIRYRIRRAIEVHDLRAHDLADALELSVRSVRRWMDGATEPGWEQQCAIADYFDLPIWWLHTNYHDGCDLLGWPAYEIASDRAEAALLVETMRFPNGWSFTQRKVDEALVARIAAVHGLPVDDVRRVAYPTTSAPRARAHVKRPYTVDRAISRALHDNPAGTPFEPKLRLVGVAAILNIDTLTITRWATGATEISPSNASRLAFLLAVRSWTLWLPPAI